MWHTGTRENALLEDGNTYIIIGDFAGFQREDSDEDDIIRGRCRVVGMIQDFGGKTTGMVATIDTNYVIVGAALCDEESREIYEAQLKEARTLEVRIMMVDEVMQCIGVEASAITDNNVNQHRPLYLHKPAVTNTYSMYSPPPEQEGVIPPPNATEVPSPAEREARGQRTAHGNSRHNANEDNETAEMARLVEEITTNTTRTQTESCVNRVMT